MVTELLALNRRLANAYLLKEQLAHLWDYTYEGGPPGASSTRGSARYAGNAWRALDKVAQLLSRHLDGLSPNCYEMVPFGKVGASPATSGHPGHASSRQ